MCTGEHGNWKRGAWRILDEARGCGPAIEPLKLHLFRASSDPSVLFDLDARRLEDRVVLAVPVQVPENNYSDDQRPDDK